MARLAYSLLLLLLIAVFAQELLRVWVDRRLRLGSFQYYAEGEAQLGRARGFVGQVRQYHQILRHEFAQEAKRRELRAKGEDSERVKQGEELLTVLPNVAPIHNPRVTLSDLEMTVQGVNLSQILSAIRGWFTPANELTGTVHSADGIVTVSSSWSQGPSHTRGDLVTAQQFNIVGQTDDAHASFFLASSLIWAEAAATQRELSLVPSDEFCEWAYAWWLYRQYVVRVGGAGKPSARDLEILQEARRRTQRLIDAGSEFTEVPRLFTSIVEAMPVEDRTSGDREFVAAAFAKADRHRPEEQEFAPDQAPPPLPEVVEVTPGRMVWIQGPPRGRARAASSVTAVVSDAEGTRFLVLPDYVCPDGGCAGVGVFLDPDGRRKIAELERVHRVTDDSPGIALARVLPAVSANNTLPGQGSITHLDQIEEDDLVDMVTLRGKSKARVAALDVSPRGDGAFARLQPRVTRAGDGGAPILDASGALVAMAHSGEHDSSFVLPLQALFERLKLTLVKD